MKMMFYCINENLINGVVIMFINIIEIKWLNEELVIILFVVVYSFMGIFIIDY